MHFYQRIEQFSLDCRIGIGFGFGFGFTTSFGWLVYLLWFWFYDSQVKTALLTDDRRYSKRFNEFPASNLIFLILYIFLNFINARIGARLNFSRSGSPSK